MMTPPLYSIIIPVKGRLDYTKEAISSVLAQQNIAKSAVEIIVVEEKNPPEIIRYQLKKLYPQVKIILNNFEDYSGGSRNAGLVKARGKYIIFLDSDDQMKPKFIAEAENIFQKDKKCSSTVCFSTAIFAPEYKLKDRLKLILLMLIRDLSMLISYFINNKYLFFSAFYLCQISHMMFKKTAIKNMKFDYQYSRGGEDWDFINRVQNKGPIRILPQILTNFRYSYNSSTILPINKKMKWQSYLNLASKLSKQRKQGVYYKFFLQYINLFRN